MYIDNNYISQRLVEAENNLKDGFLSLYSVTAESGISEHIDSTISSSRDETLKKLAQDDPYSEQRTLISKFKNSLNGELSTDLVCSFAKSYCQYSNDDFPAWQKTISKFDKKEGKGDELRLVANLLIHKWEQSIDNDFERWLFAQIADFRRKIKESLEEWLNLMQQLKDSMDNLSIETGLLFDLSAGTPSLQALEEIKKWVEYINKNESVKNLCEMLGRMRGIEQSQRLERIDAVVHYENRTKNISSKEEYVGIKLGNDIENVLKSELSLLNDPDLELLFDKKFVEKQLLCFDMSGYTSESANKKISKLSNSQDDENCGPIIICVDTSGSMHGLPETIAKAVTLYMAFLARKQDRSCYLINFSTQIDEMDFSKKLNLNQFVEFLRKSFRGGTDAAPALTAAINKVKTSKYEKADVLMISDFVMPQFKPELLNMMSFTRELGNKFYALSISKDDIFDIRNKSFDDIFIYNSSSSDITSMMNFARSISIKR